MAKPGEDLFIIYGYDGAYNKILDGPWVKEAINNILERDPQKGQHKVYKLIEVPMVDVVETETIVKKRKAIP